MAGVRLDNPAIYQKDMYKAAFEEIDKADKVRDSIYKIVSGVKGAGDKATQMLGLGDLERHTTEGQDINFRSPAEGWTYYVKYWTFSGGLSLTFEAVQDTMKLGNFLNDLAATWAESSEHTKEEFAARPFNEGGTLSGDWIFNGSWLNNSDPSGDLMYDSKPLFCLTGNNYTHKGGGTYYNSTAGLTLSPANFQTTYILHTATNNRTELDRPSKARVDTCLTREGADYLMAKRIFETMKGLPGGQLNDKNIYEGMAKPVSWPYITDTAYYVGQARHRDFQFHERQTPLIDFFEDKTNKGYKASFLERYGVMLKSRPWTRGGGTSGA
jgi:hypothetical protein